MVEDADEIIQQQESRVHEIAKKLDDVALEISQSKVGCAKTYPEF